ncbi:ethylene-responsive transcription factor ERF008-like protein [Salvia divinorum]|uniref:Ethylene-responsive transcription factor ERF008-like protein n=1 Tax=Salvia divinorum TaxID=28513 RepID=A0ABD1GAH1_SALDI
MEGSGAARVSSRRRSDKPYKGIRMRKWGKWVAEIREPNKRSRIWLGSYSTAVAAARAYDTAVYYLRGPTAKLNFPDQITAVGGGLKDLSAASIRKKAAEVGARVDALQSNAFAAAANPQSLKPSWFQEEIDLNKQPEPETEPEDSGLDYSS